METKVYYGEYSLWHWIELILSESIELPPYQRSFVWTEVQTKDLMRSFYENNFVPPVTIGAFKELDGVSNYILDGQQRITSIVLSYLGYFPDKSQFKEMSDLIGNENDDEIERENNDSDKVIEWTFKEILKFGKSKEKIIEKINNDMYKKIKYEGKENLVIDDVFLKSHYLGFSYIVPQTKDKKEQQKLFSTTFRNINVQGKMLTTLESRKSLYFLNEELNMLFDPDCVSYIKVNDGKIDFTRYLAFLSNSLSCGIESAGYGYGRKLEKFYEEFVYFVSECEAKSDLFIDFSQIRKNFPKFNEKLKNALTLLELEKKSFSSIIECDLYFFGLVFVIYFENKEINSNIDKTKLKAEIDNEIERIRTDAKNNFRHLNRPSSLKYIRERIKKSIEVYQNYAS